MYLLKSLLLLSLAAIGLAAPPGQIGERNGLHERLLSTNAFRIYQQRVGRPQLRLCCLQKLRLLMRGLQ
jgi:hypothetical protein